MNLDRISEECCRRQFLAGAAAAAGGILLSRAGAAAPPSNPIPICAFVKFVQQYSFDELAEKMAALGVNGIEATVRRKGQIEPARVEEELPRLVEALHKVGLEVTIMSTNVNRADEESRRVLKTAAGLGIKRYRMWYYQYDLSQPVWPQLQQLKPIVNELAALNSELGIQGLYQNHAGPTYVGCSLWDLHELIQDLPKDQIACAYDIRHATMEGGSNWLTTWNLIQPHLGAVYAKDCRWEGRRVEEVPLGMGIVDPAFFGMLRESNFPGPISLHVEHLPNADVNENLTAIKTDLETLRNFLQTTNTKPMHR